MQRATIRRGSGRAMLLCAAVVVLAAATALSGCAGERPALRIGINGWPPCELWQIAQKEGYFGNVAVEIVRFSSWSDNMSALYKGNLDITHASYFNAVYYSDKGEKARIILVSDTVQGGDGLAVRSGIARGEDLRGKSIAVEVNTDEHFLLRKALERYGLSESDVRIVSTTSADARDLLAHGQVDACFTYEPYLSDAAAAAGGTVLISTRELPGYMTDVLVAREATVRERKGDIATILRAWYRAQEYVAASQEAAFALMGEKEGMSATDFGAFYGSFTFYSAANNREILGSSSFLERLGEMSTFLLSHKGVGRRPALESLYDASIVGKL